MGATVEALIVVAIGLGLMGYFIYTLMTGVSSSAPLISLGTLVAFLCVWAFGLTRTS